MPLRPTHLPDCAMMLDDTETEATVVRCTCKEARRRIKRERKRSAERRQARAMGAVYGEELGRGTGCYRTPKRHSEY